MIKFLKLKHEILEEVAREKLTFLVVPKDNYQKGQELDLVAYGQGAFYDDSVGYLRFAEQQWTSTVSGWADSCRRDVRPLNFDEAYKLRVTIISLLNEEPDELFGYENLPEASESEEIIFVLVK